MSIRVKLVLNFNDTMPSETLCLAIPTTKKVIFKVTVWIFKMQAIKRLKHVKSVKRVTINFITE